MCPSDGTKLMVVVVNLAVSKVLFSDFMYAGMRVLKKSSQVHTANRNTLFIACSLSKAVIFIKYFHLFSEN